MVPTVISCPTLIPIPIVVCPPSSTTFVGCPPSDSTAPHQSGSEALRNARSNSTNQADREQTSEQRIHARHLAAINYLIDSYELSDVLWTILNFGRVRNGCGRELLGIPMEAERIIRPAADKIRVKQEQAQCPQN